MLQELSIDLGAVRLNYLDHGSPMAEPLVMFHGGAWCWQEFLSLIPSLAQRWHVYALDLRGNGRSGWVQNGYRLRDFAEDNAEFVSRLRGPAVLVGHSIGGVIALMVAARLPDRTRALIIEDAPLTLENYKRVIDSSREMFRLWLDLKRSATSEQELSFALADAYRGSPDATSAWLMFFASCLWQLDPTFFDALLQDFEGFVATYDYQRLFAAIRCPVLFLRGETIRGAVAADEEVSWLQRFGNVRCVQIQGVGHLLHLESQGQAPVLAEMNRFLESI